VHPPHAHPDPWTLRRRGNELVGRGALDAKGQIAALVAALEAEREAAACVLITVDEEGGGLGSELASVPDGPWWEDGGIVLEPTGFAICSAQAGNVDVVVDASAPAAHAYAPRAAASPVTALLSAIEALDTCRFLDTDHPLLGRPRLNVGLVRGGEHRWRTPAGAHMEVTLGVVPGTDLAAAVAEVGARLDECARRRSVRGVSFLYEIVDTSEPHEIDASSLPIASRLAAAAGVPLAPAGMPSWTDAGNLLTKHGLPCVVFGAGDLAAAHSDHESVDVRDLVRLAEILRNLLRTARPPAQST
jgi:acetylornithine deacetylase/succinyl-diaminopimelate desuccinylase-like protein